MSDTCATCRRPMVACVCDRVVELPTRVRVLILQHPQEQDVVLGSAQIVEACLPSAQIVVGLSWRNLADALGDEAVDAKKWAVLFPDRESEGDHVATRKGVPLDASDLEGIVVLDGTWSKAKTLWWRNAWLNKMNRMTLSPKSPSIYGHLRKEPKRDYVSTLESVAQALTQCGEDPKVQASLERIFRTMVQRVRDAKLIPAAVKRSERHRRAKPRPPQTPQE